MLRPALPRASCVPLAPLLLLLLAALAARPAAAAEGVVEINQARALAGGVTAADAPGFPVTIGARGSYRLTSDLTLADASTTAIDVNADDVTIDLGGFSIVGTVTCSGLPAVCTGAGPGTGIEAVGRNRVRVRNGRVRGMGNNGITLQNDARVEDVIVSENGGPGVTLAQDGTVERVEAHQNNFHGIALNSGRVSDAIAEGNGTGGIAITTVGSVSRSLATSNGGHGVAIGTRGLVSETQATGNSLSGFLIGTGTVTGCAATANVLQGFSITNGNVQNSAAVSNGGFGVYVNDGGRVGYGNLVLTGNNAGAQVQVGTAAIATAHALGGNLCGTDTTCP